MNGSPSKFAGIAAVMVLGVGMLIVGFSLPAERHDQAVSMRWTGAFISVAGLLVMAVALSETAARKALCITMAAIIFGGMFVYLAASSEIAGTATYHSNIFAKGNHAETVTRELSPVKFRTAVNWLWVASGLFFGAAAVSFLFYRQLEE